MGKTDEKGEPVQTVTIGGKKVDVPIIFILPEESGEKEIERYQHPKVHIESKKENSPLTDVGSKLGGAISDTASSGSDLGGAISDTASAGKKVVSAGVGAASAGKKVGEAVSDAPAGVLDVAADTAKLSETLSSESEEKPLDELTHGKLEEVEKLPFPVPKEKKGADKDALYPKGSKGNVPVLNISGAEMDERDAFERFAMGSGLPQERGVRDSIVAPKQEMPRQKEISEVLAEENKGGFQLNYDDFGEEFEAAKKKKKKLEKGYSDEFKEGGFSQENFEEAPKKKKKKKKEPLLSNSWEAMRSEWFPERKSKDCKDGKCSKKPSKPSFDPSKVADEKFFKTEDEARGIKGATAVLRHRNGMFTPVFGDDKELGRVFTGLEAHNRKKPSPTEHFDPEQNISDLSGETQERTKGLDSGDDDPRRDRDRDPDEDVGQPRQGRRPHKETSGEKYKRERREAYDKDAERVGRERKEMREEEHGTVGMGHAAYPTRRKILPPKDYNEHTLEEKEDIEMAKRGEAALPVVERKVRGEKRPSLYAETVGHRSLRAGLTPEQAGQNMHMGTVSEENAELWKSWLQKRDDWDKEEKENTDRHFGRKLRENEGTKRGIKEGLYEELSDPKLEGNIEDEALVTLESGGKRPQSWGGKKIHYTDFDVEGDLRTGKKLMNETAVTPSRVVGTGRRTPHSALAEDARHSDGSEALNITQGNAKLWKSWLENKSLGALGWGKLDRKTGKKKKLRRRQPTLDDYPDNNGDKKDES